MNLPKDTHLAYTVWTEAWWYDASRTPGDHPQLMISASAKGSGGGVAWEFPIESYELGGEMVTRLKMFNYSYQAMAQVPEFFAALMEQRPGTLDQVRAILDALGAVDETERVSPYTEDGRRLAEPAALDRIAGLLEGDYSPGHRDEIAEIVRRTGRKISNS